MKILDLEYKKMELMCPCGDVLKPNPEEFEKGMLVSQGGPVWLRNPGSVNDTLWGGAWAGRYG